MTHSASQKKKVGNQSRQIGMSSADKPTELAATTSLPKDARTGLTLPLSKHLGSQELAKHRAMLAMECEFLAKKFDRFGWERERNTPAQDRQKLDFMDALQDYPLGEVQAACRAAVLSNPNKMPNEGHVRDHISQARAKIVAVLPRPVEAHTPRPAPTTEQKAAADALVAGFAGRRIGGAA